MVWEIVQGFNELPDIDDMRMNTEYSGYFQIYLRTGYHQWEVKSEDIPRL